MPEVLKEVAQLRGRPRLSISKMLAHVGMLFPQNGAACWPHTAHGFGWGHCVCVRGVTKRLSALATAV